MAKPVTLPTLGPAIEEAILVKWLVAEGAYVKRGDPIFSVETDKTLTDCESLDEGYLTDIAVEEGATVRIDQVLAMLGEQKPGASSTSAITPALKVIEPGAPAASPAMADVESLPARAEDARLRISPRARRSAREAGVPIDGIERIAGSGPDGRIVHRDVAVFVASAEIGRAHV